MMKATAMVTERDTPATQWIITRVFSLIASLRKVKARRRCGRTASDSVSNREMLQYRNWSSK